MFFLSWIQPIWTFAVAKKFATDSLSWVNIKAKGALLILIKSGSFDCWILSLFLTIIFFLLKWANSYFVEQILMRVRILIARLSSFHRWSYTECWNSFVLLLRLLYFLFLNYLLCFNFFYTLVETTWKLIVDMELLRSWNLNIWIQTKIARITICHLDGLHFFETLHVVHDCLGICSGLNTLWAGW